MHLNKMCRAGGRLDRRGIAMPLALLGLVVITILVTTALLTSSTHVMLADAQLGGVTRLYQADGVLESYINQKAALVPGELQPLKAHAGEAIVFGGAEWRVSVTQLRASVGQHPTEPTRMQAVDVYSLLAMPPQDRGRRVGALYTMVRNYDKFSVNINAGASVSSDNIKLPGGSARLSGIDTSNCATGNVAGLALAAGVNANQVNENQVEGGIQQDTVSKANYARHLLNGMTPEEFARIANIKWGYPTGTPNGYDISRIPGMKFESSPDSSRTGGLNWGCPTGLVAAGAVDPCLTDPDKNHFPVVAVKVPGNSEAQFKGVGQGVLVVLGDARFNAGFIFKGIVVVVGDLTVNGGTNVYGAMVSLGDITLSDQSTADNNQDGSTFNGQSLVKFDRCQLNNAIEALSKASLVNQPQAFTSQSEGWFELVR